LEQCINQHDEILRLYLKIAEMGIPAIMDILEQIDVALDDGADPERFRVRKPFRDNMAIARLALIIHNEVNRRIAQRSAKDATICRIPHLIH